MISFYLEMFVFVFDSPPCASHIMYYTFFMNFRVNICRDKVEMINVNAESIYFN